MMCNNTFYIFDFDSTFIKLEGLDELAKIVLKNNAKKEYYLDKINTITKLGVEGIIPFDDSLNRRFKLIKPDINQLNQLILLLKNNITNSFLCNKNFFHENRGRIYIVSGGFKEWIIPTIEGFGIAPDHIYANTLITNNSDVITGYDKANLLCKANGKTQVIKNLNLSGDIKIIGDGYTDYEVKKNGEANTFYLFTENIVREGLVGLADYVVDSLDKFLDIENKKL